MPAEHTASGGFGRSITANPVFLLTALGLILYGFLRLANSLFYTRLAVKPEEVGLGYAETLSQSAVGVFLVLGFGFAIFGLVVFFLVFVVPAGWRYQPASNSPTTIEKVLSAVTLAVVVAGEITAYAVWDLHTAWNALAIVGGAIGGIAGLREIWVEVRTGRPRRLVRSVEVVMALAAILAVVLILVQAWDDGRGVREGQVRHPTFLGFFPFGSWGADAAYVEWVGGQPPSPFSSARRRCLVYLGQSNGTAVFYDAHAADQRTIRVPAGDVVVTTRNSRRDGQQACA
jgi:hypothetical protein